MSNHRVFAISRDAALVRWIGEELDGLDLVVRFAPTVREVATMIVEQAAQFLVVDFHLLDASEHEELRALRAAGWGGTLIGLGSVRGAVRTSLTVARVLSRPLGSEALRKELLDLERDRPTTKLGKLDRGEAAVDPDLHAR